MKNLKELREYLNSIPDINRGGCLISAYAMFLYLKKTNQLPSGFKILQIAEDESQRFMLMKQLQSPDPTKYTGGCEHAMCSVDGIVFDSGESRPLDIDVIASVCSIPVDPETQGEYILAQINTDGWNSAFKRAKHIPEIEKELDIDLSKVKLHFTDEDKDAAIKTVQDEQERLRKAVTEYRKTVRTEGRSTLNTYNERNFRRALSQIFG